MMSAKRYSGHAFLMSSIAICDNLLVGMRGCSVALNPAPFPEGPLQRSLNYSKRSDGLHLSHFATLIACSYESFDASRS